MNKKEDLAVTAEVAGDQQHELKLVNAHSTFANQPGKGKLTHIHRTTQHYLRLSLFYYSGVWYPHNILLAHRGVPF